jgi:CBS domain-containing protein
VEAPDRYALALAGGAGLGVVIGYVGVHIAQGRSAGRPRDAVSIGQVYLAYGVAWLLDWSSVAAAMFAVIVYVAYGTRRGLWPSGVIRPTPIDAGPVYGLAVIALAFFAWQTHVPLTPILLLEVGLGLLATGVAVWVGRALKSATFHAEQSFLNVIGRVGLLLAPALLLWPRGALIDPAPLALALLAAGAATLGAHVALTPLLSLYAWFDEVGADVEHADQAVTALPVRDLMAHEFATARPDTPVPDLARQLLESPTGCVLIVEADGRLMGIVTESDLFVKPERLPHTGQTYPALFKEPVLPEQLPDVYAQIGSKHVASDVMNPHIVWVKDSQSVGRAIRLMTQHGFRRLPVVNADPASGGQVMGVLTRAGIIRWLSDADRAAHHPAQG